MQRTLISALVFVLANAAGLLVASLILGADFGFSFFGFLFAAVLLSIVEAVTGPLIEQQARKNLPALQGGIALVITFVGLWVTNLVVGGMHIAGLGTSVLATLLVWIGALIAGTVLPHFLGGGTKGGPRKG